MKYALLIVMLCVWLVWLSGCQSQPVRVDVPIAMPCIERMPEKPDVCKPKDDSRAEYLRCVLVNGARDSGYKDQLDAVLTGCVGDVK